MAVAVVVAVVVVVLVVVEVVVVSCLYFEYFRLKDFFKWSTNAFGVGRILLLLFHWVGLHNCDPTARNESHWYSVTIQNATIFDLQVKYIDFRFSSKLGTSGIILLKTLLLMVKCDVLWQLQAFKNCNCCNIVVCETNFLSPISQNGTLYGSQIDSSVTFEPVGRFT